MATPPITGPFSVNAAAPPYFPSEPIQGASGGPRPWRVPAAELLVREKQRARNAHLTALLPLVKKLALGIRSRLPAQVELDDLVGDGVLGLMDAVEKFDASRRVRLECYARYRIRGAILDGLRALDPATREVRKKTRKVERIHQELLAHRGGPVGDEEMAEGLGVSLARWFQIQREIHRPGGEEPVREEQSPLAADGGAAGGVEFETPFDFCYRREQREILGRALAGLPEQQRLVVSLYDLRGMTMKQIAVQLRVDESRISQLHSAALRGLREHVNILSQRPQPTPEAPGCSPASLR